MQFIKDKLTSGALTIFIFLLLLYLLILFWKWNRLPPQLPLFYSLPKSEEQLGTPLLLILLPLFSIVFFIADLFIARVFYTREKLASSLLVIIGTTVSFFLFITFIKIIFLIT